MSASGRDRRGSESTRTQEYKKEGREVSTSIGSVDGCRRSRRSRSAKSVAVAFEESLHLRLERRGKEDEKNAGRRVRDVVLFCYERTQRLVAR